MSFLPKVTPLSKKTDVMPAGYKRASTTGSPIKAFGNDIAGVSTKVLLVNVVSFVLVASSFFSCAGQAPPDGGPIDLEPPKILSSYPAPFTLQFQDNKIVLEFDEYVDRRSVEESIFISPHVGELEFDWSGREVEILFLEPLRDDRTYVVTVGTDVVDINNKNRMAQAFTLAFSTGEAIDRGAITGQVYPAKPNDPSEGVMVFAYILSSGAPDTLNPISTQPDFITQTGQNGEFAFQHIMLGRYRVMAVRDEFRNLLYDPESDEFGVTFTDIDLTEADTLYDNLLLRLAKEDTTAPRLIKITAQDLRHLVVEFSEAIDTASVLPQNFSVFDTVNNTAVPVAMVAPIVAKPATVIFLTDDQVSERAYKMIVENVRDLSGNATNPFANSLAFEASGTPDTAKPSVVAFSLPDSTRGIEYKPVLRLSFSDFMDRESVENGIVLKDSLSVSVRHHFHWLNAVSLEITPAQPLASLMWHTLTIDLPSMKNTRGVQGVDKPRIFKFETVDADALSSIEGTVRDRNSEDQTGAIILTAKNTARDGREYSMTLEKEQENYSLTNLPEGQYILSAFRDRNSNGKYDAGRPLPFTPSERFAVYSDTLKLRARWPLEGVRLELR